MKRIVAAALCICLVGSAAAAPDGIVTVQKTPAAMKDVAAFPRLSGGGATARKINKALVQGDLRVKKAAKDALASGNGKGSWSRTVDVTMRGPGFISYVAHDDYFYGAYPDVATVALVFDLGTGIPVDWAKLMPASLAVTSGTSTGADGTVVGTIAAAKLTELYIKAVKTEDADAQCDDVLKQTELHFIAWPDVKTNGLVLQQMDLPHVAAACGPAATIPMATLRELGVDAKLLDAMEAGRKAAQ